MTSEGNKCVFLKSLTTPTLRVTPPMEGNLFRDGTKAKFPSAEGWRALRDGVVYSIAQASVYSYVPVASL